MRTRFAPRAPRYADDPTPRSLLGDTPLRALTVRLIERATTGWPHLSDILTEAFKAEKLPPAHRGLVSDTLHALVRMHRKVQFALPHDDHSPDSFLVATLLLTGGIAREDAAHALQDVLTVDERIAELPESVSRLGIAHSLPDWLAKLLIDELGEVRANAVAAALMQQAPQTLRVNSVLTTVDAVLAELAGAGEKGRYATHAVSLSRRMNVFGLPAFQEGSFEMQDEASQLVCELVAPPPGATVVDGCAGAGGKTLALGALMKNKGRLVALDTHSTRLFELRRRARRAQVFNVEARKLDPTSPTPYADLLGKAERVLVDAPCSGLGALRRNPEARWRLKPEDLTRLSAQQKEIALQAAGYVAPGGRLIYATCTFLRLECEEVVQHLLTSLPGWEHVRAREVLGGARTQGLTDDDGYNLRTWPDQHGMDGFFAAVLRRRA